MLGLTSLVSVSIDTRLSDEYKIHRYLVDSASSHMLVSKIKPCMSKNRDHSQIREWLITTALVYWIYKSYMDTCGNSRANTRKKALTLRKGRIY